MHEAILEIATERYIDEVAIVIVKVSGKLDGATYASLVNAVRRLVEAGEKHLVFDLQAVTELGSGGLIALHQAARLLRGDGVALTNLGWGAFHALEHDLVQGHSLGIKLLRPSPSAIKTLVSSGFAALVEPYATPDAAAASFRAPRAFPKAS